MRRYVTSLGQPIQINGELTANVDVKYGPYLSPALAYAELGEDGMDCITIGLTVGIVNNNNEIEEYWFKGGTGYENLVKKQEALEWL